MFSKIPFHVLSQINIFYYLCLTLVVVVVCEIYSKRRSFHSVTSKMPTAYGLPFLGIIFKLIPFKKFFYVIDSYFARLKCSTYCAWLGTNPFIITVDPEVIKTVLSSEEFLNKSSVLYTPIDNTLHNGLITSSVFKWKHNRKLINSSFTHTILTRFIPIFNNGTQMAIQQLDNLVGSGERNVYDILKQIVIRNALETSMGITLTEGTEIDDKLLHSFNYMMERIALDAMYSTVHLGFLVHTPSYYNTIRFVREHLENLIKSTLSTKEYEIQVQKSPDDDTGAIKKSSEIFINQAIGFHKRGQFEIHDVITESLTMIAGSYDTVSTTLSSVLIMLAMHPEIQEKLHEEVCSILPNHVVAVEHEHLPQTPYMDMVIDETLRLMPSIPVIGRETVKDTHLTNDIALPKNMQVMIPIFLLHRSKDIWGPDANTFNPDNFLPENTRTRHAYAYIPFSKGARNCIGWRYAHIALRVMLLGLVRKFKFSTSFKYDELVFVDHISLRYDVEPKLQIERRI